MSLYAKDPFEAKDQFLINKHNGAGLKHCNDSKAFVNKIKSNISNKISVSELLIKNLLVCLVFTERYVDYRVFTLNI